MFDTVDGLIFEVTTACNLKCIHCGYHMVKPHEISTESIIRCIHHCKAYGLQNIMLTGGEPFLHKDISLILKGAKELGIKTKVATNGTVISPKNVTQLSTVMDEVVISMDAVHEKTYHLIRGKNKLSIIKETINYLLDSGITVDVSFLIQRKNYTELIDFLYWCKEAGIHRIALLVPHYEGDFTSQLMGESYCRTIALSHEEVADFRFKIEPQLYRFFSKNTALFGFDQAHLNTLIAYLCSYHSNIFPQCRDSICMLPMKTLFVYANGEIKLCPYHKLSFTSGMEQLFENLAKVRSETMFDHETIKSTCRYCLEVPIG